MTDNLLDRMLNNQAHHEETDTIPSNITLENRRESFEKVLENLGERKQLVARALQDEPDGLTARELASKLHSEGKVVTDDRNMVQPRLTELVKDSIVKVAGRRKDKLMNRQVSVYKLVEVL